MEYNKLGRTGLNVSRVGFGGGGIGQVWGATTRDEAVRAVHRALDLGINFFDVAPAYGDGKAEEALGLALEGRSDDVIIATKVRLAAEDMNDVTGAVQRSMETSLRLLKRDSVDVLHVHNRFTQDRGDVPNSLSADDVLGPVLDAFHAVQQAGKTRFIGLSAMDHHVPTLDRIMDSGQWDTVLAYYNLLNWTAQQPPPPGVELFDNGQNIQLAKKHNMGVIGIRSHAAGALSSGVDRPEVKWTTWASRSTAGGYSQRRPVGLLNRRPGPEPLPGSHGFLPDEPGYPHHRSRSQESGRG